MEPLAVVSVSGGKDSTAVCLHLRELGVPFRAIFMDVGWDNAETYRYIREDLPQIIGTDIDWLRADVPLVDGFEDEVEEIERLLGVTNSAMVRLCIHKGMFPSRVIRWCTEVLKVKPAIAYFRGLMTEDNVIVNAIGVRRQESKARSMVPEWEWSEAHGGVVVWRPLAEWTEDEVIGIHKRHNVRPNGNYLRGASRVGCWPCIFARKDEIRRIAETDPQRIEALRKLEVAVGRRASERKIRKGETLNNLPSWFQNPTGQTFEVDGRQVRSGDCWPIDRVVEWAKTSRGGRQVELFALPQGEEGCLRWGFCEADPKGA